MKSSVHNRFMTLLYILLGGIALIVLAVAIALFLRVENWSRDLTTNVAATDETSPDERLRPVHSPLLPAKLADEVESAARQLPGWELAKRDDSATAATLHFVRTTPWLRFRDDIRVQIVPAEGGSLLTAESRSRVGKGDLGQNPRNLRELLGAVRRGGE